MDNESMKSCQLYLDVLEENRALILQLKKLYAWIDSLEGELKEEKSPPIQPSTDFLEQGATIDEEVERRLEELERKLERIYASRSWRLTRPLRAIGSSVRRMVR